MEALDEMARQVAERLAALGNLPPDEPQPVRATARPLPEAPRLPPGLDELIATDAGWADWRRRLADWRRRVA